MLNVLDKIQEDNKDIFSSSSMTSIKRMMAAFGFVCELLVVLSIAN